MRGEAFLRDVAAITPCALFNVLQPSPEDGPESASSARARRASAEEQLAFEQLCRSVFGSVKMLKPSLPQEREAGQVARPPAECWRDVQRVLVAHSSAVASVPSERLSRKRRRSRVTVLETALE